MFFIAYHVAHICRSIRRIALFFVGLILAVVVIDDFSRANPPLPASQKFLDPINKPLFIASIHHDTAPSIASAWSEALLKLVDFLGHDYVHVSLVDYHSRNDTNIELSKLKSQLDARRMDNTFQMGNLY